MNYCLKALVEVGHIKFFPLEQQVRLRAPADSQGVAGKAAVTVRFLARKQAEYDALKKEIEELRRAVQEIE